ncbi:MAG TPA: aspartate aminotransferase family protein [Spirochaetota bacterium]|nr:aspartate aminotransferase family protein [Spirochaetota bacterium]HOR43455.1 aspartate aminotransferase family protein [Spirochaetota bacterium]HPK55452.1 aspartate aminotransferase family protein [Spirochaetota bacterium]
MKINEIKDLDNKYLFQNYGEKLPVCFKYGEGSTAYDYEGKKYIDFLAGIAVNTFGYNDPILSETLKSQVEKIIHSSNHLYNLEQIEAAKLLNEKSFKGKTLFVNSGTEANEAAIKLSRRYGTSINPEKYKIISFDKSFHGRTFGSMTATAQAKIYNGFGPLVPGFKHIPFNDIEAFEKEADDNTCAVIIEMIQGEGGIIKADETFVKKIRKICSDKKIIMIVDEIQTGIGRTGKAFAYQHYVIEPDIITLAKGLAGGVPIGAIHAKDELVQHFPGGAHGTTFGGNHLASAGAKSVLSRLDSSLLKHINKISDIIVSRIQNIMKSEPRIKSIRGMGLLIGIEMSFKGRPLVLKALENGLLMNCTSENIIRFVPALNITEEEVSEGLDIFEKTLKSFSED